VELEAEPFCIKCHVKAKPGDVLGEIRVRRYLSSTLSEWAVGARLTALVGTINIILGTIILYWLLKVRMDPLLALRSTVSRLAKGRLDLSYRGEVRSQDEFGELATDLNHFLDRMSGMCDEMRSVLTNVLQFNDKVNDAAGASNERLEKLNDRARGMLEQGCPATAAKRRVVFSDAGRDRPRLDDTGGDEPRAELARGAVREIGRGDGEVP